MKRKAYQMIDRELLEAVRRLTGILQSLDGKRRVHTKQLVDDALRRGLVEVAKEYGVEPKDFLEEAT